MTRLARTSAELDAADRRLVELDADASELRVRLEEALWARIAGDLKPAHLDRFTGDIGVGDIPDVVTALRKGEFTGRAVVDLGSGW